MSANSCISAKLLSLVYDLELEVNEGNLSPELLGWDMEADWVLSTLRGAGENKFPFPDGFSEVIKTSAISVSSLNYYAGKASRISPSRPGGFVLAVPRLADFPPRRSIDFPPTLR